jgi:UDP-N-acetylglucosamine--N-acetylmuramyl-(pentapeptide) pyrophosphoryl-undecaprenol N-acetylglucosamine transferase
MLKNLTNFSNVFSRFGDLVLAVLVVCIIGLLIIPLPTAMRDHQHFNADAFASSGAADEGIQSKLAPRQLCRYLLTKYDHPEQLARMGGKMKLLATPDAAARVADLVEAR